MASCSLFELKGLIDLKHELPYFRIGSSYGGQQEWLSEYMMRIGGCAAVTACDCSIYFELYKNLRGLYPFDKKNISRADYIKFTDEMKPYLHPRWSGIDKLSIYIGGFGKFLRDRGEKNLQLLGWTGDADFEPTHLVLKHQIDNGYLVPCLTLNHKNPLLEDYVWHWFLLTGYEISPSGDWFVKVVSYGIWRWINFDMLWDTGFDKKGGLILFRQ